LFVLACIAAGCLWANGASAEHDYYRYLSYTSRPHPDVGLDKIEQEGGANAAGYKKRVVQWWPRKGQDRIEIPEGAPLRTWTRNIGQGDDPRWKIGFMRHYPRSVTKAEFDAHLVGIRGFGTASGKAPVAVLRMPDGRRRGFIRYGHYSKMFSEEDAKFVLEEWRKGFDRLRARTAPYADDAYGGRDEKDKESVAYLKHWTDGKPDIPTVKPRDGGAPYPRHGWHPTQEDTYVMQTQHFHLLSRPKHWGVPGGWMNEDPEIRNRHRTFTMEYLENFWTYLVAAGAQMPYWARDGENYKYMIQIYRSRCAGGWGHCGIGDCNEVAFGHEFFHGQPNGNGWGNESMCNAGQHTACPGEMQMYNGTTFSAPWRNIFYQPYASAMWWFLLSDNPNWSDAPQVVIDCLADQVETTPFHTLARLGQSKGLWPNGVRGAADFLGEHAARMVTLDYYEQFMIRSKYGMPERSYLYPVYGKENCYQISGAHSPHWTGYNIVLLNPQEGAEKITVDFQGIEDPDIHSDWRACIVAVDKDDVARYSPLWNKGSMEFKLEPTDHRVWLTVSACPSAFPTSSTGTRSFRTMFLQGPTAPRHPWRVTLTGCTPGTPHRRLGDIVYYDDFYGRLDQGNTYLNHPYKTEVPIPVDRPGADIALKNMPEIKARIDAGMKHLKDNNIRGYYPFKTWLNYNRLYERIRILTADARGKRHPNGGGWIGATAFAAPTAYVGPNAMVFDGARVEGNACVKEFAVLMGPKVVVKDNAKVGGGAWVTGDVTIGGNARVLEAARVAADFHVPVNPYSLISGSARIEGNAVIKGESFVKLGRAKNQLLTGGLLIDFNSTHSYQNDGVYDRGRFIRHNFRRSPSLASGHDAGAMYANWQFNQPKASLLEDSYVNNKGILFGRPGFGTEQVTTKDAEGKEQEKPCKFITFNGSSQYASAPPSVGDFGELTVDMRIKHAGRKGCLFDFGTGDDECFSLSIGAGGRLTLAAKHAGKTLSMSGSGAPKGKWADVRVEMDSRSASIWVDDKAVARGSFAFAPRSVFIGDLAEGNFIACDRARKSFFAGSMDHFRIYRAVHKEFASLGPAPRAVTHIPEWSEEDQIKSTQWTARRRAKDAEINKSPENLKFNEEIKKLNGQKAPYLRAKNHDALTQRIDAANKIRRDLDKKMRDDYTNWPDRKRLEKEANEARGKMNAISNALRQRDEYKKFDEQRREFEAKMRERETAIRTSGKQKELAEKRTALGRQRQELEASYNQIPEIARLKQAFEAEKDGQKRRTLQGAYNKAYSAKRDGDPAYLKIKMLIAAADQKYRDEERKAIHSDPRRRELQEKAGKCNRDRDAWYKKMLAANQEYSAAQKTHNARRAELDKRRKAIEEGIRNSAAYKKAGKDAHELGIKRRNADRQTVKDNAKTIAAIDKKIAAVRKQAADYRYRILRSARLAGENPYPTGNAAGLLKEFATVKYYARPDWPRRGLLRVAGKADKELPKKYLRWRKRVGGY
jgi:hypothetical protein